MSSWVGPISAINRARALESPWMSPMAMMRAISGLLVGFALRSTVLSRSVMIGRKFSSWWSQSLFAVLSQQFIHDSHLLMKNGDQVVWHEKGIKALSGRVVQKGLDLIEVVVGERCDHVK